MSLLVLCICVLFVLYRQPKKEIVQEISAVHDEVVSVTLPDPIEIPVTAQQRKEWTAEALAEWRENIRRCDEHHRKTWEKLTA